MLSLRSCSLALFTALLVLGSSSSSPGQQPKKIDSDDLYNAHMMLRQAYADVKKNYYDTTYHGVDLDATYRQYDARLDSSQSINETFRVIAAFLFRLRDSHTFFLPPMRVNPSTPGFVMEMVGDKCFVTRIRPGTDAATKLHVGDQVVGFDGFAVKRADFASMHYFLQILSPAPEQVLQIQSPTGEMRQVTVQSMLRTGKKILDFTGDNGSGDIWDMIRSDENDIHLNRERAYESGDVLIWKMPSFENDPQEVDAVFSKARKYKTLIIDLRGNPGGSVDTLKDALSHVFDHDVTLFTRVSRKDSKPEVVKSRGNPYTGKLIVLIDSESSSAAELFARVIQIEHRGEVIGDRSAGAVMEARHYDESLGADVKIFYGFSITSADLVMTDGKSLENTGVTPDEIMLPTAADLAAGKDPVLSHAADLAGIKLDPVEAGKLFPFEWEPL
jgi:C-terminal processing protease CtpA/Prc